MDTSQGGDGWLYAWAVGSVAAGAASLLVPLYVVQLGGGPVELGILASSAAVVGAPGAIVVGRIADRGGNRGRLLLGSLAGIAATLLVLPLLSSVWAVVVVNAALWFVWAAVAPVLTMLVVDGVPEAAWNRRIGQLNTYQGWGWAGGLVLGLGWTAVGARLTSPLVAQRSLFVALAGCAGIGLVAAGRSLSTGASDLTTRSPVQTRRIARLVVNSHRTVKGATFLFTPNRLYWTTRNLRLGALRQRLTPQLELYFLAALCFFAGSAAFWAPLPVLLTRAGYGSGTVFGLYLAASLASAALYGAAGRAGDRLGVQRVQVGALTTRAVLLPLVAIGGIVAVATAALAITTVVLTLVGATWAVMAVAGTAIVTRLAPSSLRAEALGIYTALGAVAGGIGSLLGGWLAAWNTLVAFGAAGTLVLAGAGLVVAIGHIGDTDAGARTPESQPADQRL